MKWIVGAFGTHLKELERVSKSYVRVIESNEE